MKEGLFAAFTPQDAAAWKAKIVQDLKGKEYDSLITHTEDGIAIRPDYTSEDRPENTGAPGFAPYSRGLKTDSNTWEIARDFKGSNARALNKSVLDGLQAGVNLVWLSDPGHALDEVLKDVLWPYISLILSADRPVERAEELLAWSSSHDWQPDTLTGCLGYDPIGDGLLQGNWPEHMSRDQSDLLAWMGTHRSHWPRFRYYQVSAHRLAAAGATPADELGMALAWGHEYLVDALEKQVPIDEITARIQFTSSIGTDYFAELVKLRALRTLWARIVSQYDPQHDCSHATYILGCGNDRYFSALDPYTNMIRATTMGMAGALGGVDALYLPPFDVHADQPADFGQRIAQNVSLILQEESHLDKVLDPAAGSYFLESLNERLCDRAWSVFQEIEAMGGFRAAVESGWVQSRIETTAQAEEERIRDGSQSLVGVNKYPNPKPPEVTLSPASDTSSSGTFPALHIHRLAHVVEHPETTP